MTHPDVQPQSLSRFCEILCKFVSIISIVVICETKRVASDRFDWLVNIDTCMLLA